MIATTQHLLDAETLQRLRATVKRLPVSEHRARSRGPERPQRLSLFPMFVCLFMAIVGNFELFYPPTAREFADVQWYGLVAFRFVLFATLLVTGLVMLRERRISYLGEYPVTARTVYLHALAEFRHDGFWKAVPLGFLFLVGAVALSVSHQRWTLFGVSKGWLVGILVGAVSTVMALFVLEAIGKVAAIPRALAAEVPESFQKAAWWTATLLCAALGLTVLFIAGPGVAFGTLPTLTPKIAALLNWLPQASLLHWMMGGPVPWIALGVSLLVATWGLRKLRAYLGDYHLDELPEEDLRYQAARDYPRIGAVSLKYWYGSRSIEPTGLPRQAHWDEEDDDEDYEPCLTQATVRALEVGEVDVAKALRAHLNSELFPADEVPEVPWRWVKAMQFGFAVGSSISAGFAGFSAMIWLAEQPAFQATVGAHLPSEMLYFGAFGVCLVLCLCVTGLFKPSGVFEDQRANLFALNSTGGEPRWLKFPMPIAPSISALRRWAWQLWLRDVAMFTVFVVSGFLASRLMLALAMLVPQARDMTLIRWFKSVSPADTAAFALLLIMGIVLTRTAQRSKAFLRVMGVTDFSRRVKATFTLGSLPTRFAWYAAYAFCVIPGIAGWVTIWIKAIRSWVMSQTSNVVGIIALFMLLVWLSQRLIVWIALRGKCDFHPWVRR